MIKYILVLVTVVSILLVGCTQAPNQDSKQVAKQDVQSNDMTKKPQRNSTPTRATGRRMLAEDFSADLRSGTTVVYFAKISCPSCKKQDGIWKKVTPKLPAGVKFEKRFTYAVNYRAYGVTQLPTLVFYKDGIEVSRNVGVMSDSKIMSAAKRAM